MPSVSLSPRRKNPGRTRRTPGWRRGIPTSGPACQGAKWHIKRAHGAKARRPFLRCPLAGHSSRHACFVGLTTRLSRATRRTGNVDYARFGRVATPASGFKPPLPISRARLRTRGSVRGCHTRLSPGTSVTSIGRDRAANLQTGNYRTIQRMGRRLLSQPGGMHPQVPPWASCSVPPGQPGLRALQALR